MSQQPFEVLLDALLSLDASNEERTVYAGSYLVWRLCGHTVHKRLSSVLPAGLLLVTRRLLYPDLLAAAQAYSVGPRSGLDADSDLLREEISSYRLPRGESTADRHLLDGQGEEEAKDWYLLEERLQPVDLQVARNVLSALSRNKVSFRLPVLFAVERKEDMPMSLWSPPSPCHHSSELRIAYVGLNNMGPRAGHADARERDNSVSSAESLQVVDCTVGGRAMSVLHVLSVAAVADSELVQAGSQKIHLSTDYCVSGHADEAVKLAGSSIHLQVSWEVLARSAASVRFLQQPQGMAVHATVSAQNSQAVDDPTLRRLRHDVCLISKLREVSEEPDHLHCLTKDPSAVFGDSAVRETVDLLLQRQRLSLGPDSSADGSRAPTVGAPRPPVLDFMDRAWELLLSRCATSKDLVLALQLLLNGRGRSDEPPPRLRANRGADTPFADLVRLTGKGRQLTAAAAAASTGGLETRALKRARVAAEWSESATRSHSCAQLLQVHWAADLAWHAGVDYLQHVLGHIIFESGEVGAAIGLCPAGDRSNKLACERELARSLRLAEISVACRRAELPPDVTRSLLLSQAAAAAACHRETAAGEQEDGRSAVAAPVTRAVFSRLLSSLPAPALPEVVTIRFGGASVRLERDYVAASEAEADPLAGGCGGAESCRQLYGREDCHRAAYRLTAVTRRKYLTL
eukprot:TRINITY_DN58851_c1_g1_i1.p1 TRINITY_DN58851_c1_g1~~TRINITY_DN58851_c1_g1_i1.p1  ORF type:complete len:688 (-),score=109.70 TRINITY_DN58851_c1_g1_i1:266-2329(-)